MFVAAVNGVAGMKPNDLRPPLVGKDETALGRGQFVMTVGRGKSFNQGHVTGDKLITIFEQAGDTGMVL